jgi:hypothetical protein
LDHPFLVQVALSAAAIAVMVSVAAWARIARPARPLTEARARQLLALEFPDRSIDTLWIAADGAGALARSQGLALVICAVGDGFAARQLPWAQAISSSFRDGRLCIDLADVAAPKAVLAFASWPPRDLAA